jgi:trimeric autotransporter adhesin
MKTNRAASTAGTIGCFVAILFFHSHLLAAAPGSRSSGEPKIGQQVVQGASASGYVIEWGWNPGLAAPLAPTLVCSNAVAVSPGAFHRLALRSDRTVYGWGSDFSGAVLGNAFTGSLATNGLVRIDGLILTNVVAVAAARYFSEALKTDGTVVTWGKNYVPKDLSSVESIAAADGFSLAALRDGTVVGWAADKTLPNYGELIKFPELSNVVAIAIGESYHGTRNLALTKNGTVVHWGTESTHKDATPPADLSNVIKIAAGNSHSLALKKDGTVVGWGWNKVGQATGSPTSSSPDGLNYFSAGTIRIEGQILTNVVMIAAGRGYSMALKKDGTVVAWGRMVNDLYPVTVPEGLSNVVAIAAGDNFCLAITTNSAVAKRFADDRMIFKTLPNGQ